MNNKIIFRLFCSIGKSLILVFLVGIIINQMSNKIINPIKINDIDPVASIQNNLVKLVPELNKNTKFVQEVSYSIKVASEVTNIDDKIITSIAYYESRVNEKAKSSKGYKGIMQATRHDIYEFPEVDIMRGAKKLESWLKHRKGNLRYALASYNGGNNPPKQSYDYADKIIKLTQKLKY